jgi:protein required for attachment to host cells
VAFEASSGRPSNIQERWTATRHRREAFAAQVAEAINAQATQGDADRLSLVAPARVLNAIERGLTAAARAKLSKTLAKDLTKVPDHELKSWLEPLERN